LRAYGAIYNNEISPNPSFSKRGAWRKDVYNSPFGKGGQGDFSYLEHLQGFKGTWSYLFI
jgi:hypothetical protein